ncbi:MAG: S8 family serine peptidase [Phycisphaerae bacterium]|nr:S8 family serine peptidase [Phycisphaerae bacterium]
MTSPRLASALVLASLLCPPALAVELPGPPDGTPVKAARPVLSTKAAKDVATLEDLRYLGNPNASFTLSARTDDARDGYVEGERFRLRITAGADCCITVVAFGPDGSVDQIAPAKSTTGSADPLRVKKDEVLLLPRGEGAFRAMAPHGETMFRIFATKVPIVLPAMVPSGSKGVGVDEGPPSPLEGNDWTEATVLVMTGSDDKDLAERLGVSVDEVRTPPLERGERGGSGEDTEFELPDLQLTPPKPDRERPARKNPRPAVVPISDGAAVTEYLSRWERIVRGESGNKSIGKRLVPALPTQRSMPKLDAGMNELLVVRRGAPAGSKGIPTQGSPAGRRYTTERVPLARPGSKAIGAGDEAAIRARIDELRKADRSIVTIIPNRPISIFTASDDDESNASIFSGLQWHLSNDVATDHDIRWINRVIDIIDATPVMIGMVDQGIHVNDDRLKPLIAMNAGEVADNGKDDDGNGLVDDVYGWNFASDSPQLSTADDRFNHGSYCTSIIGGNSGGGRMSFFPVAYTSKVIQSACMAWVDAEGTAKGSTDTLLTAIEYAVDRGAKVINLSLGGPATPLDLLLLARHPLFDKLEKKDVLLVIAAGNENIDIDQQPVSPACIDRPNTIVVMAIDPDGKPAREWDATAKEWKQYSNWGRNHVHIAAPGTMILGIPSVDSTSYGNGTSYAAPIVTGAAALLWGRHPEWDSATVKRAILESARQVEGLDDKCLTGGMLDLDAALNWTP